MRPPKQEEVQTVALSTMGMAAPSIHCESNLYCAEDALAIVGWDDLNVDDDEEDYGSICEDQNHQSSNLDDGSIFGEYLWNDSEELSALAEKEKVYAPRDDYVETLENNSFYARARQDAVSWILKVTAHYGFGTLTAVLSVNYLDRFLSRKQLQEDKPWMTQLAAVTCLSLAAKVEETEVPLLLDLQVEEAKYVFEPRTIQRMELLVLSALDWRMTSVTPLSYIDHASRLLGLKSPHNWIFAMRCNDLLLNTLKDTRFLLFLPSVVAAVIMTYVIKEIEPMKGSHYEERLLHVFKVDKEAFEKCMTLISLESPMENGFALGSKRKCRSNSSSIPIPNSPSGVLDASFSCDSGQSTPGSCHSTANILCMSPAMTKKRKLDDICSDLHLLKDL